MNQTQNQKKGPKVNKQFKISEETSDVSDHEISEQSDNQMNHQLQQSTESRFGWTHIGIFLVVAQSSVLTLNIYQGLIFYILPIFLIIIADVSSCTIGFLFGRKLIFKFGNKKSLEGIIGGSLFTFLFAFIISAYLQDMKNLYCPQEDFTIKPFEFPDCTKDPLFQQNSLELYSFITKLTGVQFIKFSRFQLHSLVLAAFANLIVPFGGLFGSKLKSSLLKQEGSLYQIQSLKFLNGITDRMDCQLLIGMFTYLYLHQVIMEKPVQLNEIKKMILQLSVHDQFQIYQELKKDLGQLNVEG